MPAEVRKPFALRVLGIDPAAAGATGFAIVDAAGSCCSSVHFDTIAASRNAASNIPVRLQQIHDRIAELIDRFSPECLAIESIFTALNIKTALRLAEVRGVILLAAAQRNIPVHSYSPREVKAAVAGYGHADKAQMQQMVRAILSLKEIPQPSDAADALAVALCHIQFAQSQERFGVAAQLLAAPRSSRRTFAALGARCFRAMKRKMKLFPRIAILLCLALVAVFVVGAVAAARPSIAASEAVITYRKVFKGSTPESVELIIRESGKCTYDIRQLAEDPKATEFEVGQPIREKIFSLAKELNYFKNLDLDTHRKIANLGAKTFRYEKDGVANEVTYNYTVSTPASQLQQIFEGLSYQQDYMQTLARTLKYDRLGLYDVLGFLEADLDNGVIPEPEHLLPVLEQISNDTHVIEIARSRARAITTRIRNGK